MTTRTERKKTKYKNQILNAAKKLFNEQGYKSTTTKQIAETADVGEGTIYNYFKNKADIYVEILLSSFAEIKQNSMSSEYNIDSMSLVETINHILQEYINYIILPEKSILKEFFGIFSQSVSAKDGIAEKCMQTDMIYLTELENIFFLFKKNKRLEDSYDVKNGAELVYSIMVLELIKYIYVDEYKESELRTKIKEKLSMIF